MGGSASTIRVLGPWLATGLSVIPVAGCSSPQAFQCSSDTQCVVAGIPGTCEATGYCSFPDMECASGRRYGDHATAELAGHCVEPMSSGTAGTGTGSMTTSASTLPTSTDGTTSAGTTDDAGTSSDADSTLGAQDSDTGSPSTSPAETTADTSTSESGTPPDCADPLLVETFEGGWDAMTWTATLGPAQSVGVDAGELVIAIEGDPDGYASLVSNEAFEIGTVTVDVELVAPLEWPGDEAETLVFIEDEGLTARAGFAVFASTLLAVVTDPEDGPMAVQSEVYDPDAHRWLRIRTDPMDVEFATSPDGETWNSFGTASTPSPPMAGETTHLRLTAGVWMPIEFQGEARFDDVVVCATP